MPGGLLLIASCEQRAKTGLAALRGSGEGPEEPVDRVLCFVACGERSQGGLVGRVGVSLAARERDGEIVDWARDGDRGPEVLAICWSQWAVAQHTIDVSVAADHRRRGHGADAFEPGKSVGGIAAQDREVGVSTAWDRVAARDLGFVDHRQS